MKLQFKKDGFENFCKSDRINRVIGQEMERLGLSDRPFDVEPYSDARDAFYVTTVTGEKVKISDGGGICLSGEEIHLFMERV